MKKFLTLALATCAFTWAIAQPPTKIVLQLQTGDTVVHRMVVNQVNNLKKSIPDCTIELVCHGPGIDFLVKQKSLYADRLDKLKLKDVSVVGCEFTMSNRNLTKNDLVQFAGTVPFGITELVKKQADGWIYIKLGF